MISIHSHYVRALMKPVQRAGLYSAGLLADVGLHEDEVMVEDVLIQADKFVALTRKVWELLDDEYWCLSGTPCKLGLFSLTIRYLHQFDTLDALLSELCRFQNTVRSDLNYRVEVTGEQVVLSFHVNDASQDEDHLFVEFAILYLHRFFCWITGKQINLDLATFTYPEPKHSHCYDVLFPCEHLYQQPQTSILFSATYLGLPLVRTWSEVKQFLRTAPTGLLIRPTSDDSVARQVKIILMDLQREGPGFPSFDKVAEMFCFSPQTLRRKLLQERTSFQKIKDTLRKEYAIQKLVRESLSVAEVAHLLGFLEPTSFTRAFKQWTGLSPSDYRLKALAHSEILK